MGTVLTLRRSARRQLRLIALLLVCCLLTSKALAVVETQLLAVDMGANSMKVAAFRQEFSPAAAASSSQSSVSIVLNDQTNRKSPPCIAFRYFKKNAGITAVSAGEAAGGFELERSFAEQALALGPRFPSQVVCSPALLLGQHNTSAARSSNENDVEINALRQVVESNFQCEVVTVAPRDRLGVRLPYVATTSIMNTEKKQQHDSNSATDDAVTYSADELVSMLLGYARHMAEKADRDENRVSDEDVQRILQARSHNMVTAGDGTSGKAAASSEDRTAAATTNTAVRYAAVTVPTFASLSQRQAMVDAGALSGMRVVRLVHSTTAAATQLAYLKAQQVFPARTAGAEPAYIMIYDIGSRQTEAALFEFSTVPPSMTRHSPGLEGVITMKAMAMNQTLGGKTFDECIANYWDQTFLNGSVLGVQLSSLTALERQEHARKRVSLLRAATRARETLSANKEAIVEVEGVAAASDGAAAHTRKVFSTRLSRATFEDVCAPLFEAAVAVRDQALSAAADMVPSVAKLSRFEVIGGATRMPKLLSVLSAGYGPGMVDRTLNGDEAAVMGTAYLAVPSAKLGVQRFMVREWLTNDIGFALSPKTEVDVVGDGAKMQAIESEAHLLFPTRETMLPDLKSIKLRDRRSDFVFTFVSPLIQETAAPTRFGTDAVTPTATPPVMVDGPACFAQHNHIAGVSAAIEASQAEAIKYGTKRNATHSTTLALESTEVVVEAAVSESGLPYVNKAYLRAIFIKTVLASEVVETTTSTASEGPAVEAVTTAVPETLTDGDEESSSLEGEQHPQTEEEEEVVVVMDADIAKNLTAEEVAEATEGTAPAPHTRVVSTHMITRFLPLTVISNEADTVEPASHAGNKSKDKEADTPLIEGFNLNKKELNASRQVIRALQAHDDKKFLHSSLRNDIEAAVLAIKSNDAWERAGDPLQEEGQEQQQQSGATDTTVEHARPWRETVQEISNWLDDYGEEATIKELMEKRGSILALKKAVLSSTS